MGGLSLLGGGAAMPMVGIGMCCRGTAYGNAGRQAIVDWLLMGGRHIDDAAHYKNHQEVGAGIDQAVSMGIPREEIFLTTKLWPDDYGYEQTSEWVDQALSELGLKYIDLVLMHLPLADGSDKPCGNPKGCRQEAWLALQRAKAAGKIRHLGVSNFGPKQMGELLALRAGPVEVNQLEFHPWVPKEHRDTVAWCHENQIAVTAYGSMGSNAMAADLTSEQSLQQLGARHGKTAGQVLLRWALQKNVSVIPGTSNPKHMIENLQVFDFELSPPEMAVLDNVPEDQHLHHFGHWPDRCP